MVVPTVDGIDLFKIADRSISGWIPVSKPTRFFLCDNRLTGRWPTHQVEAAVWKLVGDSLAAGHLLIDLEGHTLDRHLPLALLPPDAVALPPPSLPDTLLADVPMVEVAAALPEQSTSMVGPTIDASTLSEKQREQFYRNLRVVELVKSPKCTFSGSLVSIDLQRFQESGVDLVECPDCASTRTLSPYGGVLRFKSHEKRKTNTPNTGPRWVRVDLTWSVVRG